MSERKPSTVHSRRHRSKRCHTPWPPPTHRSVTRFPAVTLARDAPTGHKPANDDVNLRRSHFPTIVGRRHIGSAISFRRISSIRSGVYTSRSVICWSYTRSSTWVSELPSGPVSRLSGYLVYVCVICIIKIMSSSSSSFILTHGNLHV